MIWPGSKRGAGKSSRQYIYVLINLPFFWIVKVGITADPKRRWNDIDRSSPGKDVAIFWIKIWGAYYVEQFVLSMCSPLRRKFWGSGRTERFLFLAAIPAIVLSLFIYLLEYAIYIGLSVLFFWILFNA